MKTVLEERDTRPQPGKERSPVRTDTRPRVSIGVPVYNGERYIAETIDSILAQTFRDFELIISDNASTDGTSTICRRYAAADGRIRYFRNERNLGAAKNFNFLFTHAGGEYFKWASADNLIEPTFIERCVEVLDARPDAVVAFTKCKQINDFNETTRTIDTERDLESADACERLRNLRDFRNIRVEGIKQARWYDPRNTGLIYFPHWRRMREYFTLIAYSGQHPRTKLQLMWFLCHLVSWRRIMLAAEIWNGFRYIFHTGHVTKFHGG